MSAERLKIYMSDDEIEDIDVIGRYIASRGVDGIQRDDGTINRSSVIRKLIYARKQAMIDSGQWDIHKAKNDV